MPVERVATGLLLAVYLVWVLLLPAWPSQDGPVHLFYTHVLGQLLAHSNGGYSAFFRIKHLFPPYALYYYLLLLLSRFVPLLVADRIVVCAYLVIFLTGFRALARAVAPDQKSGADRATLLATLLLLNWPLGMGFVNYCLSFALALWALALWFRANSKRPVVRGGLFLVLVGIITLTHPVPLLLVLAMAGLDVCARWWRVLLKRGADPRSLRQDACLLLLASLPLLYVKAFAARRLLEQRTPEAELTRRVVMRVLGYAQGRSLTLVYGSGIGVSIYRAALFGILCLALAAALHQGWRHWKQRRHTASDLFTVAALVLLAGLPILPSDISGAYFFPERLVVVVWTFALVGAAGWQAPVQRRRLTSEGLSVGLVGFTIIASVALLLSAEAALRPFGVQARNIEHLQALRCGELVLALEGGAVASNGRSAPSWNPEYWMAVHVIRGSEAVLANAPWLDSSIIPLAALPTLPAAALAPRLANSPHALTGEMSSNPALAKGLIGNVSAIAVPAATCQPETSINAFLSLQHDHAVWNCRAGLQVWEKVSVREP